MGQYFCFSFLGGSERKNHSLLLTLLYYQDLGTPTEKIWSGVKELPGMKKCTFAEHPYNTLRQRFGSYLTDSGFGLLNK